MRLPELEEIFRYESGPPLTSKRDRVLALFIVAGACALSWLVLLALIRCCLAVR